MVGTKSQNWFTPPKTNMTSWKIHIFNTGNTSTHSWWIFHLVMLVFGEVTYRTPRPSQPFIRKAFIRIRDVRRLKRMGNRGCKTEGAWRFFWF